MFRFLTESFTTKNVLGAIWHESGRPGPTEVLGNTAGTVAAQELHIEPEKCSWRYLAPVEVDSPHSTTGKYRWSYTLLSTAQQTQKMSLALFTRKEGQTNNRPKNVLGVIRANGRGMAVAEGEKYRQT